LPDLIEELLLAHVADGLDDHAVLLVDGDVAQLVGFLSGPHDRVVRHPTTTDVRHQLSVRFVIELTPDRLREGLPRRIEQFATPGGHGGHRLVHDLGTVLAQGPAE
jgi:hypothetical protein